MHEFNNLKYISYNSGECERSRRVANVLHFDAFLIRFFIN